MHILTQSALLQALGWMLFNSLWQMGLCWLLYKLITGVFAEMPARSRHSLILLLLVAGTLWSTVSFADIYLSVIGGNGYGSAGILPMLYPVRRVLTAILPYGSSVYLLMLAGLLVRSCHHYFHSVKLTRKGLSRIQPEFRVFVDEARRRMGIRPVVKVWLSKLVDVPMTFGFLKPVILLPLSMATHLTTQQIEAVLVHELAHIHRKDFLINLGITVLEGIFFFNPFTRWMIADLKKEREHCCDDLVLQFRYDPHSYVSALLSVARQQQNVRLVVAATGNGNNQLLLQRAKRILHQERTNERPGRRSLALLLLTLLVMLVTLSKPGQPAREMAVATKTVPLRNIEVRMVMMTTTGNSLVPAGATGLGSVNKSVAQVESRHTPAPKNCNHPTPAPPPNVADAGQDLDEELAPMPVLQAALADGDWVGEKELVLVAPDNRDYSMYKAKVPVKRTLGIATIDGQPFVAGSSYSYQSIEEDTVRPEEKLARLQQQSQREIALSMQKLQLDLMAQLGLVKRQLETLQQEDHSWTREQNLKMQQTLMESQLKLQRDYLQKLDELQKRLKKLQGHHTIVYI